VPLLDDAVTDGSIGVTDSNPIVSVEVGVVIAHPRESDLALTLISPEGDRILLAENRGGTDTNGYGIATLQTNYVNVSDNGTSLPDTNTFNIGTNSGSVPIVYNFYTAPDEMSVYYGTNVSPQYLILDTGMTNNPTKPGTNYLGTNTYPETLTVTFPPPGIPATNTFITVVMNEFGNTNTSTGWTYSINSGTPYYSYFWFTEDTNKTTVPIKFAPPPFHGRFTTNVIGVWTNNFQTTTPITTEYDSPSFFAEGWQVASGSIDILASGFSGYSGGNFAPYAGNEAIDINGAGPGVVVTNVPLTAGQTYTHDFAF
jgi:hypothetical protein